MEALRSNFNYKLPEGVSEDVNFEIMKPLVGGKKKFLETGTRPSRMGYLFPKG